MSWAAADRMATLAARHAPAQTTEWHKAAETIREQIIAHAWNPRLNAFTASYGGDDLDASLLEMASLHFLPPDDPRLRATIQAIRDGLSQDGWMLRYRLDDGFGRPTVAFIICSFWLVEALVTIGQTIEARNIMAHIRGACSPLGLLSEDCETGARRMWGNFPQAYSHIGLIHAAFAASPRWSEML